MFNEVGYVVKDQIASISLKSMSPNNKLNHQNIKELIQAFKLSIQDNAKVVVLTGNEDVFCGGGTIGDFTKMTGPEIYQFGQLLQDMVFTMKMLPIPIIGAINGNASGGGFTLMEACDYCIAAQIATFSIPEITSGFCPAVALVSAEHALGVAMARKMAMTGEAFDTKKALELNLIIESVDKENLMDVAFGECQKITRQNPTAYRVTKEIAFLLSEAQLRQKFSIATGKLVEFLVSDDAKEALAANNEKRLGNFTFK